MIVDIQTFEDETCLLIPVVVKQVLEEENSQLSPENIGVFTDYCSLMLRWQYSTKPKWEKWIKGRFKKIDPREQCKVWIRHWLKGFEKDRVRHILNLISLREKIGE